MPLARLVLSARLGSSPLTKCWSTVRLRVHSWPIPYIKLFELQTPRNVLKHMTPKWGGHIWPFHHALRSRWVGGDQLSH